MGIDPVFPGFDPSSPTSVPAQYTRLEITVFDDQELSVLLARAVNRLIPAALERRQGILITQVLPDRYAVEVSGEVLCGVIEDKRINPDVI